MSNELADRVASLPCADTNCDGKGTVCLGEHHHENGEVELGIHQCEMCDTRDKAAAALRQMREVLESRPRLKSEDGSPLLKIDHIEWVAWSTEVEKALGM